MNALFLSSCQMLTANVTYNTSILQ